ncbi:MAG: NUDIX domain-containing protein [SAR202 cluster bacterium]|nr:NUDIX domain-containing protein [SAR202 cluster bacterium]|tara:strand:- start:131 stop:589 length:459 start_codon:yes stop_codon:yes gene_type:complete
MKIFCEHCGNKLIKRFCSKCKKPIFDDPKLAVASIIVTNNKILLIKRGVEPKIGKWAFPSGYVNKCETPENALIREVKEETGLTVDINQLIGIYSEEDNPVVLIVYSVNLITHKTIPGSDADDLNWFELNQLPELAFKHDNQILQNWKEKNC